MSNEEYKRIKVAVAVALILSIINTIAGFSHVIHDALAQYRGRGGVPAFWLGYGSRR